ncbi:hypothetical protein DZB88_26925 [Bacillus sp. OE]|nr:hypothetical protein DN392_27620 [Bacillus sp. BB51/4]RFB09363.1 hypothetical protein DZB88_26925 [Bacillus sp. OE]
MIFSAILPLLGLVIFWRVYLEELKEIAKVEIFLANDVEDDNDLWVCKRTKFYHKSSICFIEKRNEIE